MPNAIDESPSGAMIVDEEKCIECGKFIGESNTKAITIVGTRNPGSTTPLSIEETVKKLVDIQYFNTQ